MTKFSKELTVSPGPAPKVQDLQRLQALLAFDGVDAPRDGAQRDGEFEAEEL